MFLVIFTVFWIHEMYQWGLWNSYKYTSYTGCSEKIYNYERQGINVHSDSQLTSYCFGNVTAQRKNRSKLVNTEYQATKEIVLFTKCGIKQPHLISSRTAEKETLHEIVDRYDITKRSIYVVPNIVHYVSFGRTEFQFLNYLSILSVHKFIKPLAIYIHGSDLPYGVWWQRVLQEVPGIYHVTRDQPIKIQGRSVRWIEHSSDIMRLQTLYDNGGIYLDTDIIVLKSFDKLRKYQITLGRESNYGLGSGIIVAAPASAFLCIWKETYRNYKPYPWNWATYAVWVPSKLSQELPNLIHIEENTLQKPSWNEPELLFNKLYKWSDSYAIHVWKRFGEVPRSPEEISSLNTTLGEVMRYIYHGSSQLLTKPSAEISHTRWNFNVAVDLIGTKILSYLGFNT